MDFYVLDERGDDCPNLIGPGTYEACIDKIKAIAVDLSKEEMEYLDSDGWVSTPHGDLSVICAEPL